MMAATQHGEDAHSRDDLQHPGVALDQRQADFTAPSDSRLAMDKPMSSLFDQRDKAVHSHGDSDSHDNKDRGAPRCFRRPPR